MTLEPSICGLEEGNYILQLSDLDRVISNLYFGINDAIDVAIELGCDLN